MTAVLRILKDLFTPLMGAPQRAAKVETTTDLQALGHVANIAEVFNADAAADEQLAGHMLRCINSGGALGDDDTGGGEPVQEPPPQVAQVAMEPQPFRLQFFLI